MPEQAIVLENFDDIDDVREILDLLTDAGIKREVIRVE
jgi:UDP-N-acetylglucosamine enolpyruvyl transferase